MLGMEKQHVAKMHILGWMSRVSTGYLKWPRCMKAHGGSIEVVGSSPMGVKKEIN